MKWSRLLAAALCCGILAAGCAAEPEETAGSGQTETQAIVESIPENQFPDFGGCESLYFPGNLAAAAASGSSFAQAAEMTSFTDTNETAWKRLENGELDLIVAYAPDAETQKRLKEKGFQMQEIGTDALVFLSGAAETRSLTVEQLLNAYRNTLEGWVSYSSAPNTDARMLFTRVMGTDSTGQTITDGAETLTAACPHGTDTLCYASYLSLLAEGQPKDTTLIAVDGVLPNEESILQTGSAGKYPLVVPYYAACRGDLKQSDPSRLIYQWMISEEGSQWIAHTAFAAEK